MAHYFHLARENCRDGDKPVKWEARGEDRVYVANMDFGHHPSVLPQPESQAWRSSWRKYSSTPDM